jgi:hypothetical protein
MGNCRGFFPVVISGVLIGGLAVFGSAGIKVQPPGPLGRPVLPSPSKKKADPLKDGGSFLSPGPPILTPAVTLPGPVSGTILVPGHWQGNRWVPGRLERKKSQPTQWVPGHPTAEGAWALGHWE